MTYSDGILKIYETINAAEPGMKPVLKLREGESCYFGFATLGITRYYTAMQAQQLIECVVRIPDWTSAKVTDICILEDGTQYRIAMLQKERDENGLKMSRLSLERLGEGEEYDFED